MGRKVHPMGFRLGVIRDWQAKWYADKHYVEFLQEDLKLRKAIQSGYSEAGVSQVEIDRQANKVVITIYTARPGVVIGRGGQRVDEMRQNLESLVGKRIQLNIQEIRQPELDAYLVARSVAEQIERRIAYRRAMKQAVFRTIQAGAKGMRINCAGRLAGAEIARREMTHEGQVPLHTLRADIDYGFTEARTPLGRIGVKVWIYKGDILPEPKVMEVEEMPVEAEAESIEAEAKPIEAEAKPVEAEAKPIEAEAKPTKPKTRRTKSAVSKGVKAEPVEVEAEPVEAEAKPTKPKTRRTKPAASKGVKAEPVEAEAKPVEAEAKPVEAEAEPVEAEAKPVEAEAEPIEAEAKPTKPKTRRTKSADSNGVKAEPVEAEAEPVETEVKPTKPKTRRTKSAVSKTVKAESFTSTEEEEKDGTAQAGEIPQDS